MLILVVLEELNTLRNSLYQKKENEAIKVIAKILNNIPEDKIVSVIKDMYDRMEIIEYDIESASKLIMQVTQQCKLICYVLICILGIFASGA